MSAHSLLDCRTCFRLDHYSASITPKSSEIADTYSGVFTQANSVLADNKAFLRFPLKEQRLVTRTIAHQHPAKWEKSNSEFLPSEVFYPLCASSFTPEDLW